VTGVLAERFATVSREGDARPAVVEEGAVLSYGRLRRWSEVIAARLDRHRPTAGRRVALALPNSAAFVAAFFGVALVDGVVAPLDAGYRGQELEHYLADLEASAILVSAATADRVRAASDRLARPPAVLLVDGPETCEPLAAGEAAGGSGALDENPLLLLHTSGSTGPAKRVVRTQAQLLAESEALQRLFAVTDHDRFLGVAPFSHVNGLVRTMLTAILAGATLYPIRQFARRAVLELIGRERLTFFGGVPRIFVALAQAPPRGAVDLSSLRIVFSSSAPLRPADNRDFRGAYGHWIRQLYGSTETGTISYHDHPAVEDRLDSVGRPLALVALAVLDERGGALPPGREGQIAVSSPFAASAYEGNPAATRKRFRDGRYLTGDLGHLDSEGYLTLTGRTGLMINRGGYKVNPYEVEEAIRQHPKVADVVVLGAPGRHGDQVVCGLVVAREACSAEELVRHCRERIADYKIPSRIEFRADLPRTPSGKIRRHRLAPAT